MKNLIPQAMQGDGQQCFNAGASLPSCPVVEVIVLIPAHLLFGDLKPVSSSVCQSLHHSEYITILPAAYLGAISACPLTDSMHHLGLGLMACVSDLWRKSTLKESSRRVSWSMISPILQPGWLLLAISAHLT